MSQITYQDIAGFSVFFQHKCFETYAKNPDGFEDGVQARRVKPDVFLQNILGVLNFAEIKRPVTLRPVVKDGLSDILTYLKDPRNKLSKLKIEFKDNPFLASIGSDKLEEKVELISVPKHTRLAVAKKVQEVAPQVAEEYTMTLQEARMALSSAFPLDVVVQFDQSLRDSHSKVLGNKPLSLFKIVLDAVYPYVSHVIKDGDRYDQIIRKLSLIWHPDQVHDESQKEILTLFSNLFSLLSDNMKEADKVEHISKKAFEKVAMRRLHYKTVDLKEALVFFERAKFFALQTRRFELAGLNVQNIDDYIAQNILTEDQFYAFFGLFNVPPREPDVMSKETLDSFNSLMSSATTIEELRKNPLYNYAYRKVWDNALLAFIASPEMRCKVTFVTFLYCAKAIEKALQSEKSIQPKQFQLKLDIWTVAEELTKKFSEYSKKSQKENTSGFSVADREPLQIKKPPAMPPRSQPKGMSS